MHKSTEIDLDVDNNIKTAVSTGILIQNIKLLKVSDNSP